MIARPNGPCLDDRHGASAGGEERKVFKIPIRLDVS